jgi:hypothetical protein
MPVVRNRFISPHNAALNMSYVSLAENQVRNVLIAMKKYKGWARNRPSKIITQSYNLAINERASAIN